MTETEQIECRRAFLIRFSQFILSNQQYDNLEFTIPQRKRHINSPVIITITNGTIWSNVSWSLGEITHPENVGDRKQDLLIQCKFKEMLLSMKELEKESEDEDSG